MKVVFSGLDHAVEIAPGTTFVLEVANKALFTRLCQSLLSGHGEDAAEPYFLWDVSGNEIGPSDAFLPVVNVFDLPWNDRVLEARLYEMYERSLLEDEELRLRMEGLGRELAASVFQIGLPALGDYSFGVEWELKKYLKAFKFGCERVPEDASLLDSLIAFLDYACDVGVGRTILFVNLKTFLDRKSLEGLYERIFVRNLSVLNLENAHDAFEHEHELKLIVDQDFLEY